VTNLETIWRHVFLAFCRLQSTEHLNTITTQHVRPSCTNPSQWLSPFKKPLVHATMNSRSSRNSLGGHTAALCWDERYHYSLALSEIAGKLHVRIQCRLLPMVCTPYKFTPWFPKVKRCAIHRQAYTNLCCIFGSNKLNTEHLITITQASQHPATAEVSLRAVWNKAVTCGSTTPFKIF